MASSMNMAGMDQDRGPSLLAATWVLTSIALAVLGLRLYTRISLTKAPGLDDWTMLFGTSLNVTYSIMMTVCVSFGLGKHLAYLGMTKTPGQVETALLLITICQAVAINSFTVTKLSVAFLLIRLFTPKLWTKVALLALPVALICISIVTDFVIFFQCDPIKGQWTPSLLPTTKCWDSKYYVGLGYALGTVSAVIDICFGLYPLLVLSKLHMATRKRAALAALFATGLVAAGFTVYKTTLLPSLAKNLQDVSYEIVPLLLWTSVEANVIIIAACLPPLIPLFRLVYDRTSSRGTPGDVSNRRYQDIDGTERKRTIGSKSFRSDKRKQDIFTDVSMVDYLRSGSSPTTEPDTEAGTQEHTTPEEIDTHYTARSMKKEDDEDVVITSTYSVSQRVQQGSPEGQYHSTVPRNMSAGH